NKRNIAILAHVNAGKTTLSERLLYFGSAIPVTGEVDEGLATMDYLDEEKRRGITIEAGVASYEWKGVRTTFLDTPGHVDFGAEVDFALRAVEGAVLVVSGVSGVESQTLAAWEKVRKAGVAPMVFVNKMDAPGADFARALEQMRVLFKTTPVVLSFPVLRGGEIEAVIDVPHETALFRQPGSPRALSPGEIPEYCYDEYVKYRQALIEFASRHDDRVLRAWVEGAPVEPSALLDGVRAGLMAGAGVPVCAGSALRNAGVRQMLNAINRMLPAPVVPGDAEGSVGFVIKARWHPVLGKFFLAKIHSGRAARALKGASFYRVFAEALEETDAPEDGDIVAVRTDRPLAAGANLGRGGVALGAGYRPLLQARLEPEDAASYERANAVLRAVAETDPSIQVETDATTGGWIARTVGELQLDVFLRRLRVEHGCALRAGAPSVRLLERPRAGLRRACEGTARAFGAEATVAFIAESVENQDENHIEIPAGLPSLAPIEEEVMGDCFRAFCVQGVLGRGEIAGLRVGVTGLGGEIRPIPAPLLAKTFTDSLIQGLKNTDFEVFEPIMNLEIIVPEEFCGAVLADLAARGGAIRKIDADGHNSIIFLEIPLEKVFGYATLLRSLSKGLGVFVLTYEKHGPKKELKNKG
ncbi:MAG TPA: GTP-binding protein, partial [Fibrobacteria bacterium]|nr:GTP-binding protein [Fibrobacteria bacterium]